MAGKIMSRGVAWLVGLIGIAVIFAAINAVLWGAQKLWHLKDERRLEVVQSELVKLEQRIPPLEGVVDSLELEIAPYDARIQPIAAAISEIEANNPDGIPEHVYDRYSQLVDQHNDLVDTYNSRFTQFESAYDRYSAAVVAYNLKVDEANTLAEKVGTTWYLVPVPLPGKAGRVAR